MLVELTAGFEAIKAASSLAQALNAAATEAQINAAKLELQQRLLDAQGSLFAAHEAQTAAAERVGQLEEQIVRLKNWKRESENYELKNIDPRSTAYVQKPGMKASQAPHWLCANCFEMSAKSHLQFQKHVIGQGPALAVWRCHRCHGELSVEWHYSPTKPWTPRRGDP